jgi:hypothetical protein
VNDSPATLAKVVFIFAILFSSCQQALETNSQPTLTLPTRYEGLVGLVKVDPASDPEEIISQFAGEPHLSADGQTLYFVHHYFSEDLSTMLEADIFTSQLNNTP